MTAMLLLSEFSGDTTVDALSGVAWPPPNDSITQQGSYGTRGTPTRFLPGSRPMLMFNGVETVLISSCGMLNSHGAVYLPTSVTWCFVPAVVVYNSVL